jgi:hypothetical protein
MTGCVPYDCHNNNNKNPIISLNSINRCLPNGSRVFSLRYELNLCVQFTLLSRSKELSMIQAVSFRHVTASFRSETSPCGICGLPSGSVTRFLQVLRLYPLSIIPSVFLSSLYLHVVLTRGTYGQSLVIFKQNNAVPGEGREFDGKMLSLWSFNLESDKDIAT